MKKYHQIVVDFFGEQWFKENWEYFCSVRKKFKRGTYNKEIIELELALHPLLKEVFKHQVGYDTPLDFTKIPDLVPSDFIFSHLGRDLELLKSEISVHGDRIKNDLLSSDNFESHRFTLLVAAGYKLLGNRVEFIASSPREKRPDLLISGKNTFLIECKQRNQSISDRDRYSFFGELVEEFLPLLRSRRLKNIILDIELKNDTKLNEIKENIKKDIRKLIWRNSKKEKQEYKISISNLAANKNLREILLNGGHFRQYPVYTRTEDGFIASDPLNQNVIYLNKSVRPDKIPNAIYQELYDANSKIKNGQKLMVYFDLERGFSEWIDKLSMHIFENIDEYIRDLPNIDGYVVCQTLLKYLGKTTIVQPSFNFIGKQSTWGGTPDTLNLFGYQGHTGMDNYLIKEFIMPEGSILNKFIECPKCGYRMGGIATDIEIGQQLSQVSLPCLECGMPMDMTIQEAAVL